MSIKTYIIIGVVSSIVLGALGGCSKYILNRLVSVEKANQELTTRLENVTNTLKVEMERSARVEAMTVRLEKSDADRQKQLRGFERNLAQLAATSQEVADLLRSVIPDALLTGLRSFERTAGRLPAGQGAGASADTP